MDLKKMVGRDAGSLGTKAVAAGEAEVIAELEAERAKLVPDMEADVETLQQRARDRYRELDEYHKDPANDRYRSGPDKRAIALDGAASAAQSEASAAHDAKLQATARVLEIDALLGAEEAATAAITEWRLAIAAIRDRIDRRNKVIAGLERLRNDVAAREQAVEHAREAHLSAIAASLESGEENNSSADGVEEQERGLHRAREMLVHAQALVAGHTASIEATRASLESIRGKYATAVANRARLRWMAVCRVIRTELEAAAAAGVISRSTRGPELPRVDDLEVARRVRELESQLESVPAIPEIGAVATPPAGGYVAERAEASA